MSYLTKRIFQIVSLLFLILVFLLICQIDGLVLQCTEAFFPGYGAEVCTFLVIAEILASYFVYKALFGRPSRLVLKIDASPQEHEAFRREMEKRLVKNPHVLAAKISPSDPDFLTKAMAELDRLADQEIRSNGKKIFLGTALSQNGRLDALIMFFSLARMVWRISAIYNQKPTPEELWSVVSAISSSTFVAFSIEALDIPQTITETMNGLVPSVAPAMAASSVPFVGSAVHVFTASLIDGAANCLLAVRAGVITRRAYRYAMYGGDESLRRSCVRETGAIMLDISQESVGAVVTALRRELQDLSLASGKKLVEGAGNIGSSAVNLVKDGANTCISTAGKGVQKTASAVVGTAQDAVEGVCAIAQESVALVSSGTNQAIASVKEKATSAADTARHVGENAQKAVEKTKSVAHDALDGVRLIAQESGKVAELGASQVMQKVASTKAQIENVGRETLDYVSDKGKNAQAIFQKGVGRVRKLFGKD